MFFAPCIIDYLFGGIAGVKPCVEDVPDKDVQSKLKRVSPFNFGIMTSVYI